MSFASLKANRQNAIAALQQQMAKLKNKGFEDNSQNAEMFWKPTVDTEGNGFATIRFLPAPAGEDIPYVRIWSYWFQNKANGKWYKENSLRTIGKDDPVALYNRALWNSGYEADKERAKTMRQKESYYSNILVIDDPKNPENNGKVFLYEYGKKIFEKINDKLNPAPEEGDDPLNPFDFWEGANFKLKIRKGEGGYRNYDKSEFQSPAALFKGDEAKLEAVYNQLHSLQALIAPENFRSFEELQSRFYRVIGEPIPGSDEAKRAAASNDDDLDLDVEDYAAKVNTSRTREPVEELRSAPAATSRKTTQAASDDDEDLDFFAQFAEED